MRDLWTYRSDPAQIKPVPWLAPEATEYLQSIVMPEFTVMEFGGGGSTLWFAERVKHVTTYENNQNWATQIKQHAPNNVEIIESDNPPLIALVDLLFIDGDPVEKRGAWIDAIPCLVRSGGWVVLDNANRPEYAGSREWLAENAEMTYRIQTPEGKYFVTEFYKWT